MVFDQRGCVLAKGDSFFNTAGVSGNGASDPPPPAEPIQELDSVYPVPKEPPRQFDADLLASDPEELLPNGPERRSSASSSFYQTPQSINMAELQPGLLIAKGIFTSTEWEQACAQLQTQGKAASLENVTEAMTRMPAAWHTAETESFPTLTHFQRKQILQGNGPRLRLDHYIIIDLIGKGGMGEVYLARNLNLDHRLEAIKTIQQPDQEFALIDTSANVARFEREAHVLAKLNHRRITTVYDTGREHGVCYIAMEYVKGQTLHEVVEQASREGMQIPIWWSIERVLAIADALQYAHGQNIIHRDIKPQNVMITQDEDLKILDMGIARFAAPRVEGEQAVLTLNNAGLGSPEVMPPEQWNDASSVTPASDIYSLGCTFFYMLTGRMPFVADSIHGYMFSHVSEAPPRPSSYRADVSPELDAIVQKMMAKEPLDRFNNCKELTTALNELPAAGVEPASEGQRDYSSVGKWLLASVSLCLLAVLGVMVMQRVQPGSVQRLISTNPLEKKSDVKSVDVKQTEPVEKPDPAKDWEQFLADWRQQYPAVWDTVDRLRQFADGLPADGSSDLKKQQIKEQTELRSGWQMQLKERLAELASKHAGVWKPDEPLTFVLSQQKGGLAELTSAGDIDRWTNLAQDETYKRWRADLKRELIKLQDQHRDVWPDLAALTREADRLLADSPIDSAEMRDKQLRQLERRTWSKKAERWADEHEAKYAYLWKPGQVTRFLQEGFDDLTSVDRLEAMKKAVREEAKKRMLLQAEDVLKEHVKMNDLGLFWKNVDELRLLMSDKISLEKAPNLASLTQQVGDLVDRQSVLEVQGKELKEEEGKPIAAINSVVAMQHWMLRTMAASPPLGRLELGFSIDGQPVQQAIVDKSLVVKAQAPKDGYLSLWIFMGKERISLVQWTAPAPAEQPIVLTSFTAELGEDTFLLFWSEANPLDDLKTYWWGKQQPKEIKGRFGPLLFKPIELKTDEVSTLKQCFSDPSRWGVIQDRLLQGQSFGFVPPRQPATAWDIKVVKITTVKR